MWPTVTATLKFSRDSTDGTPGRFGRPEPAALFHCKGTQRGRFREMAGGKAVGEDAVPLLRWSGYILFPENLGSQVDLNSGPRWPHQTVLFFGSKMWLLPLASGTSSPF